MGLDRLGNLVDIDDLAEGPISILYSSMHYDNLLLTVALHEMRNSYASDERYSLIHGAMVLS